MKWEGRQNNNPMHEGEGVSEIASIFPILGMELVLFDGVFLFTCRLDGFQTPFVIQKVKMRGSM